LDVLKPEIDEPIILLVGSDEIDLPGEKRNKTLRRVYDIDPEFWTVGKTIQNVMIDMRCQPMLPIENILSDIGTEDVVIVKSIDLIISPNRTKSLIKDFFALLFGRE